MLRHVASSRHVGAVRTHTLQFGGKVYSMKCQEAVYM